MEYSGLEKFTMWMWGNLFGGKIIRKDHDFGQKNLLRIYFSRFF